MAAAALGQTAPTLASGTGAWNSLVEAWYRDNFRAHPLAADVAGFHDWDDRIDDVSLAGHEAERKRLRDWQGKIEAVDPGTLAPADRDDREYLIGAIKAALLEEETIQQWRHNPDVYASLATDAAFQLVKRDYAPLETRMRFVIARERLIPDLLATAKTLLRDMPQVYVDIALEDVDGAIPFFRTAMPEAMKPVADAALQKQFAGVNAKAVAALEDYKSWLEKARPEAKGKFALGPENFRLKLQYEEMIDTPLDQLLAIGYAQLKKDQQALVAVARQIDPAQSTDAVIAGLQKDHPTADTLIPTARDQLVALRRFVVDRKLTPLPPEEMPQVGPTPEFRRALTEAELDPPGPYDKTATEAFYFITPPEAGLSAQKQDEYLRGFNIPVLDNTSVHEVFPGHFVQLMLMRSVPDLSMVRRLAWANSNVEGWAHYCEQMMLDEGYGDGDLKLRAGQIIDALLRDARFVAGVEMHARGMTLEQATEFFVKEGHQTHPMALKEAKRGTADPTYLYYTAGKLEILKLRDDWKAKTGDGYSAGAFHRRLLEGGTVPIKMIRREMMGADGPLF